jgi:CRP/FNR family transcriptional regulator, cyclic AMP receptor protein
MELPRANRERGASVGFVVDVLERDPELAEAVAPGQGAAPRALAIRIEPGPWEPDLRASGVGLLILAGFVTRRTELADRHSVELLGPGDLLRPWELGEDQYAMVPSSSSWRVVQAAHVAVLDAHFAAWASGHRQLIDRLLSRLLRRSRTLALRLALVQLPRLSARLHFLLWHLSDRFGRVDRDGVLLPVPLSHAMLAATGGDANWTAVLFKQTTERDRTDIATLNFHVYA